MAQKHDPITRAIKHGELPPSQKRMTIAECDRRATAFVGKQFTMRQWVSK